MPRTLKKTVFTLNIGDYQPAIREITFPLLKRYAEKIGADFHVITERLFPEWPIPVEKMQISRLSQEMGNDWNIFFDADALVHPDAFDITNHIPKDTVCHNGKDMAGNRWRYNNYFRRDGRHIGSCNWMSIASDWCAKDFWRPPTDLAIGDVLPEVFPLVHELNTGIITPAHLIDDYLMSRNIARFGLKFTTVHDICTGLGFQGGFFWHIYTVPEEKKLREMQAVLKAWGLV